MTARYLQLGRPASMTFSFANAGATPPTTEDCRAVADAYGLWENTGFGLGYALLRSSDSSYVGVSAWSHDRRANVAFTDTPFNRPGLLPGVVGALLPTSTCPLIRWATVDGRERAGRTYAVGITNESVKFSSDQERVNGVYLDALTNIFRDLRDGIELTTGYSMVILHQRGRGQSGFLRSYTKVRDCGVYELMGTQRRRTRPG